jgi:hypothetical protein
MRFSAWSVLWILVVVPAAATAQTNLYLLRSAEPVSSCLLPGCSPDRGALIQIDADAGRISSITPIPNARGPHQQLGVTPDGRYVRGRSGICSRCPHYRAEVSLSPGGPYGALETPLTSIAGAVPNGTYFARVRGVNFGGVGPSSEEIVVRVPQ